MLEIYNILVEDFASDNDPISPYGVKSNDMLESAVGRQFTGFDGRLKYDTAVSNAATLCFGLCCNHPFHNGNKRTALVSLMCHLDKNERTFEEDVAQDELYRMMIRVASHTVTDYTKRSDPDKEVESLGKWIRGRTRRLESGERAITCRQLRTILGKYGFEFEHHDGNHIDVVRYEERSIFGFPRAKRRNRIMRIPYPMDGAQVGRNVLRDLREKCELSLGHGIDSKMFYSSSRPVDFFVARYSKTLRKLART